MSYNLSETFCFIYSRYSKISISLYSLIKQGYTVYYHGINSLLRRIIRKILKKIKLYWRCFSFILWGIQYKEIASFTHIVVFDSTIEEYFCNFIEHNFVSGQLIIYFLNTIRGKEKEIEKINRYKCSKWQIHSFDEQDCSVFQLKYNPMFFAGSSYLPMVANGGGGGNSKYVNRVFFIGLSKGREEKINFLKNKFDKMNVSNKIIIIDNNKPDYHKQVISYEEVLVKIQESEILLDIVREGQSGTTQRELEAAGFKKKLITDNQYIKTRNYYHEDNVFVIDWSKRDVLEGIDAFLSKPFKEIDKETMKYYTVENWLTRFLD